MKKPNVYVDPQTISTTEKENCILILSVSGTKQGIVDVLQNAINEINGSYGKPCQGIVGTFNSNRHIITPVWEGKEY
jgi:hypothetical protein